MTDERKLEIVRQFKEEIYKRFNLNVMSDENLETVIEKASVIVGHSPEKAFPL